MCEFGGVTMGGMQTPFNTIGIGDPVPYGIGTFGSGDKFASNSKKKNKKSGIATKAAPQVSLGVNMEQRPLIVYSK
jgi:hypothetical protein